MARTQPLSVDLLERLEERLRTDGAQPLAGSGPGLPEDELQDLSTRLPARLPDELALWWTWRTWGPGVILPGLQAGSFGACVEHYEFRRGWAAEQGVEDPDAWWNPLWIPVLSADGGVVVAADLSEGDASTAPLRKIDWQNFAAADFAAVTSPSLGTCVAELLDAIDAGIYVYDDRLRYWRTPA